MNMKQPRTSQSLTGDKIINTKRSILFIIPFSMALSACGSLSLQLPAPLSRCPEPLGTVVVADANLQQYGLPSAARIVRSIMKQSGCFQPTGSQQVGPRPQARGEADWIVTPALVIQNFSAEAASRLETVPLLGGVMNRARGLFGGEEAAFLEAQASLVAADGRTGRQVSQVSGETRRSSLNLFGFTGLGPEFEAQGGAYTETETGKIVTFAFMEAHNRLVKALRPPPAR